MTKQEKLLKVLLRLVGTSSLLATVAVVMPYEWMNFVHQSLGMGTLPKDPIVGYLARSLSAFYAILGGLLWVLSFDLRRHRAVVRYLGWAILLFGLTLFAVDFLEHLPRFWAIWEGTIDAAIGVAILLLSRQLPATPAQK